MTGHVSPQEVRGLGSEMARSGGIETAGLPNLKAYDPLGPLWRKIGEWWDHYVGDAFSRAFPNAKIPEWVGTALAYAVVLVLAAIVVTLLFRLFLLLFSRISPPAARLPEGGEGPGEGDPLALQLERAVAEGAWGRACRLRWRLFLERRALPSSVTAFELQSVLPPAGLNASVQGAYCVGYGGLPGDPAAYSNFDSVLCLLEREGEVSGHRVGDGGAL